MELPCKRTERAAQAQPSFHFMRLATPTPIFKHDPTGSGHGSPLLYSQQHWVTKATAAHQWLAAYLKGNSHAMPCLLVVVHSHSQLLFFVLLIQTPDWPGPWTLFLDIAPVVPLGLFTWYLLFYSWLPPLALFPTMLPSHPLACHILTAVLVIIPGSVPDFSTVPPPLLPTIKTILGIVTWESN